MRIEKMADIKKENMDNRILSFKTSQVFTKEEMGQVSGGKIYQLEPTFGYDETMKKIVITDHSGIDLPW